MASVAVLRVYSCSMMVAIYTITLLLSAMLLSTYFTVNKIEHYFSHLYSGLEILFERQYKTPRTIITLLA